MTQQISPDPRLAGQPYGPQYGQAQYGPIGAPVPPQSGPFGYPTPPAPKRRTGLLVGSILGTVIVVAGLVVGALILLGTRTLDQAELEQRIAELPKQSAGIAATDVHCPADREAKQGDTFTCTGQVDGQPASFTVTQTDDNGNVHIQDDNTYVLIDKVEGSISQQVGFAVTTKCDAGGHTVIVDGVGKPIQCTVTNASDSSRSIHVTATVDKDGNVSFETNN